MAYWKRQRKLKRENIKDERNQANLKQNKNTITGKD